jgi:hypothetical protein
MTSLEVLVFPDTGPESFHTLLANSLYAERVHSLLSTDVQLATTMIEAFGEVRDVEPELLLRLRSYFNFVLQHEADFRALEDAGVLIPLDISIARAARTSAGQAFLDYGARVVQDPSIPIGEVSDPLYHEALTHVERIYPEAPPSFGDLDLLGPLIRAADGTIDLGSSPWAEMMANQELMCCLQFHQYLLTIAAYAESHNLVPTTWSPDFQAAFLACRAIYESEHPGSDHLVALRKAIEAALAQTLVRRELPRIDDLPTEAILHIRDHRQSELEAFRAAVGALAVEVDLSAAIPELQLQLHDLASRVVDPALADLRSAVYSSRLDALSRLGRSRSLAAATTAATLSLCAGAPLDISAAIAGLGPVALSLWESALEQRRTVRTSQWCLLFRLGSAKDRR